MPRKKAEPKEAEPKKEKPKGLEVALGAAGMNVGLAKAELKGLSRQEDGSIHPNVLSRWHDKHFGYDFGRKLAEALAEEWS